MTTEGVRNLVTGQILCSHWEKHQKYLFFWAAFCCFFMGAMHDCTALQSKCSADSLASIWRYACTASKYSSHNAHQCFKWIYLGLLKQLDKSGKLSVFLSLFRVILSYGPIGQFSRLILKLPVSLSSFWLFNTGYCGNVQWGGDNTEMNVAEELGLWCPLNFFFSEDPIGPVDR